MPEGHSTSPVQPQWFKADSRAQRFRETLLEATQYDEEPIVDGLIYAGLPMVIGGAEKSMKTLLSIDLAAALTTGTSFLGMTPSSIRSVFVLSLETLESTWRKAFVEAVLARGKDPEEAGRRLDVTSNLAYLKRGPRRADLKHFLGIASPAVAILDPRYLLMPKTSTTDRAAMGDALRSLCRPFVSRSITPIIIDHFAKGTPYGDLPKLEDLSGVGVGAFARTWLLVNRQSPYPGDRRHELLIRTGTCLGHHSALKVVFDEHHWQLRVQPFKSELTAKKPASGAFLERLKGT